MSTGSTNLTLKWVSAFTLVCASIVIRSVRFRFYFSFSVNFIEVIVWYWLSPGTATQLRSSSYCASNLNCPFNIYVPRCVARTKMTHISGHAMKLTCKTETSDYVFRRRTHSESMQNDDVSCHRAIHFHPMRKTFAFYDNHGIYMRSQLSCFTLDNRQQQKATVAVSMLINKQLAVAISRRKIMFSDFPFPR